MVRAVTVQRKWYKVKNGRKTQLLIQSPVTNERRKAIDFVLYRELLCRYSPQINQLDKRKVQSAIKYQELRPRAKQAATWSKGSNYFQRTFCLDAFASPLYECLGCFFPVQYLKNLMIFSIKKTQPQRRVNTCIHLCVQTTFCGDTCATAEHILTDTNLHTVQLKFQATISSLDLWCPQTLTTSGHGDSLEESGVTMIH